MTGEGEIPELADVQTARPAKHGRFLQIGQVAAIVGLSLRTVRFYEEEGLVVPVARSVGGYRLYDNDCVERFRLIMQMKPLGFSVDEMRLLIDTLHALASDDLDGTERTRLVARRNMFASLAETKVLSLKEQLAIAERFSAQLSQGSVTTRIPRSP